MANIKSAQKRVLVNRKKNEANKAAKTAVKTEIKKGMAAAEVGGKDMDAAVKAACKKVDQAAVKGLMSKNTAARRKSSLMKKANAASAK